MHEEYYNDDELIYLVGENSEEAFDLLLMKYDPLIRSLASYYVRIIPNKLEYEDILQECRLALFMAVKRYDYTNSVLFYTFLVLVIRRRIYLCIRSVLSKKNDYYLLGDYGEDLVDVADDMINETSQLFFDYSFSEDIIRFKNELDDIDAQIFELRFNRFSYKEISILLDVDLKKIDNRMVKVRKKLKKFLFKYEEM